MLPFKSYLAMWFVSDNGLVVVNKWTVLYVQQGRQEGGKMGRAPLVDDA
jgi:hypothetical protein